MEIKVLILWINFEIVLIKLAHSMVFSGGSAALQGGLFEPEHFCSNIWKILYHPHPKTEKISSINKQNEPVWPSFKLETINYITSDHTWTTSTSKIHKLSKILWKNLHGHQYGNKTTKKCAWLPLRSYCEST